LEYPPEFRLGLNAAQRVFKLFKKVVAQPGLPIFLPESGRLQLLFGFRMARDVHGAWRECPGRFPPRDDT
jgi:hypothetical protein